MMFDFDDLFIFEMANNHQGSLKHGINIIEEIAKIVRQFGIKAAVKLQYRDLDTFIHPDFVNRKDVKHISRFLETRLSWEEYQTLVYTIKEKGMLAIITAFDENSIDYSLKHGVDILKVASCSAKDWPLLETVSRAGKPIICSTGGCNIADVDKILSFFEHRKIERLGLLHCIGLYPTENRYQNLNFLYKMIKRYPDCTLGYSGHEAPDNLDVVKVAIGIGAKIIERHVGIPTESAQLNGYSMNPEETCHWVQAALEAKEICGSKGLNNKVTEDEVISLRSLSRGLFAKRKITTGEVLDKDSVFFAMPCKEDQTSVSEYLMTMKASKDYAANEALIEKRHYDPIQETRNVVHEAKGFLREAQIPFGSDYRIELSHHYGMTNFRRKGAIIIDYFNREYCKKIIILLPGQSHPLVLDVLQICKIKRKSKFSPIIQGCIHRHP